MRKTIILGLGLICLLFLAGCSEKFRCGDGVCHMDYEDHYTCPSDCRGETCYEFARRIGRQIYCGNNVCEEPYELSGICACPQDCPE